MAQIKVELEVKTKGMVVACNKARLALINLEQALTELKSQRIKICESKLQKEETKDVISMREIERIMFYSGKFTRDLRKINSKNTAAYSGKELTKAQLIYQIVFEADAPNY